MKATFEEVDDWGVIESPADFWPGNSWPNGDMNGRRALRDASVFAPLSTHLIGATRGDPKLRIYTPGQIYTPGGTPTPTASRYSASSPASLKEPSSEALRGRQPAQESRLGRHQRRVG
eukprot:6463625-Prymnesium_polylepis.1